MQETEGERKETGNELEEEEATGVTMRRRKSQDDHKMFREVER